VVPRLIIVSNRVAVPGNEAPRQAGGLAVAVNAALKRREGIWFGWSGSVSDDHDIAPKTIEHGNVSYVVTDLAESDYQEYYNGFANRVLWPILHYRVDLAEFTAVELAGYLRVNALFANALSPFLRPDDVIWVHDYHLLSLAKELRALGHDNPIGFFLHIPCPPPDILMVLPQHAETIGALTHYDLSGCRRRLMPTISAAISRYGTASQDRPAKPSNSAAAMCTFARFPSPSIPRPMPGSPVML